MKQFEQNVLTVSAITEWRLDKEKCWEQTNTDAETRLREMECFVQKMTKQDCESEFYQKDIVPLRHLIAKSPYDAADGISRSLITDRYRESMKARRASSSSEERVRDGYRKRAGTGFRSGVR